MECSPRGAADLVHVERVVRADVEDEHVARPERRALRAHVLLELVDRAVGVELERASNARRARPLRRARETRRA
jgi:hypothetical protein